MEFYDTIKQLPEEIFSDFSDDLQEELQKLRLEEFIKEDNNKLLDSIWKLAWNIVKSKIEYSRMTDANFDGKTLEEDIEKYCIFTIFASLKYKYVAKLSLREAHQKYVDSSIYFHSDNEYGYIRKKLKSLLSNTLNNDEVFRKFYNEDFFYCLNNSIIVKNEEHITYIIRAENVDGPEEISQEGNKEHVIKFYDLDILFMIVDRQINCPYISKNIIKALYEYAKEFIEKIFDKDVAYEEKCLKAYAVERFFYYSFICEVHKFLNDKNIDIGKNKEYINKLAEFKLLPMAFSRGKYLETMYNESKKIETKKVILAINYLRIYILPMILEIYYYLIDRCIKKEIENKTYKIIKFKINEVIKCKFHKEMKYRINEERLYRIYERMQRIQYEVNQKIIRIMGDHINLNREKYKCEDIISSIEKFKKEEEKEKRKNKGKIKNNRDNKENKYRKDSIKLIKLIYSSKVKEIVVAEHDDEDKSYDELLEESLDKEEMLKALGLPIFY